MGFFSRWRRQRTLKKYAIPDALWQDVLVALPFLAGWPPEERESLRAMSVLFLREKNIVGARGFQVTPFQRVVVAAQACLPVLKLGLEWYDDFKTVVLCHDEFITHAEWEDEDGVVHRDDEPLMGEAMSGGPVVLSWPDALDAYRSYEGAGEMTAAPVNVVIHEFVHKLDMRDGDANGCPPLPSEVPAAQWRKTMEAAYQDFCRRVDADEETVIDPYAAEHPAEFFAVLSEVFFVEPTLLHSTYADVYQCFCLFYRQNPD